VIKHLRRRSLLFAIIALFVASIALGYRADDWARFDHRSFRVIEVPGGDSVVIESAKDERESVKLAGIDPSDLARAWLVDHAMGREVTLFLECPQTRDASGQLQGFVFLDNQNLSVALVQAGLAYADRRQKTVMDALIDPAETDARKKNRGLWNGLKYDQMPAWRQEWLRSLPPRR